MISTDLRSRLRLLLTAGVLAVVPFLQSTTVVAQAHLDVAEAPAPAAHAEAIDSARALLRDLMAEEQIPGLSVAVAIDGRIVWSEGFGWADLEQRVPVTTLTRFRVGSVSKPITAAALAHLVEEGAVDLDAPVQRYVPEFPEKRWTVTTRQLAGHIAGIRHYRDDEFLNRRHYETVNEGLEIFAADTLLFEPGTDYSYSSYGWNLISAVIEGASGEAFLPFVRRTVIEPLEMRHTVAGHTDSVISHRTAFYALTGEDEGPVRNAPYVDNSYKWAGGGYLSTPEDLVRFGTAHLEPGFLEAETLRQWFRSQELSDGDKTGYGIGWRTGYLVVNEEGEMDVRDEGPGERVVSHGGGSVGGRTGLFVNLDRGIVVAVTANLSGAAVHPGLAGRISALFAPPSTPRGSAPAPRRSR